MATITVETTVRRKYKTDESDVVSIHGKETKDVTLKRKVEDVEDLVWALETQRHEVVWDLWEEVKDDNEFEGFGWHGYPKGDIEVSANYEVSWHDAVEYIAERDGVDNPAGIYLDLRTNGRTPDANSYLDTLFKSFLEYVAEQGIDTNYYTHGKQSGKDRRDFI